MKKIKIVAITGSRAEYGLICPTLKAIKGHPKLKLSLIVAGMHMSHEFGETIKEIKKDGFEVDTKIQSLFDDTGKGMAKSVGKLILKMTEAIKKINPDIILVLCDLGYALGGAICGTYMNIPVAHVHGGDVSGHVDESVRHAITKLAHIHFSATKKSAERIIKMGEEKYRVFVVGAPGLDSILNKEFTHPKHISKKLNLDIEDPIILVVQHSVSSEVNDAAKHMKDTMEALTELKYQTVVIYPNADAGGRKMIKIIKQYKKYSFFRIYKNLPHEDYLGLMNIASVMVGNSSSGIIEAPLFHLSVVNIGKRQEGRERTENVIDVDYNKEEIKKSIKKAIYDENFRKRVKKCKNPYGDGKAGIRIADILSKVKIDKRLMQKKITY